MSSPSFDLLEQARLSLQNADYHRSDSILSILAEQKDLDPALQWQAGLLWSRTCMLDTRYQQSLAILRSLQDFTPTTKWTEPEHLAGLAEAYIDLALEVQLVEPRARAASLGALAYSMLPNESPAKCPLARKLAVLHRLLKHPNEVPVWFEAAKAHVQGRPLEQVRLLLDQANADLKQGLITEPFQKLDQVNLLLQQHQEFPPEDRVFYLVLRSEAEEHLAQQATSDPYLHYLNSQIALKQLLDVGEKYPQLATANYFVGLARLSELLEKFGDFEAAFPLAERALQGHLRRGTAPKVISKSYEMLGTLCHYFGRRDEALRYFELAMHYWPHEALDPRDNDQLGYAIAIGNYGQELITSDRFEEGETYLQSAIGRLMELDSSKKGVLGNMVLNLAVGFDMQNCPEEAAAYFFRAAKLLQGVDSEIPHSLAQARIGAANQLMEMGRKEEAQVQINLGLEAIANLPKDMPLASVFPLLDLTEFYLHTGQLDKALATNHDLLQTLVFDFESDDPLRIPEPENYLSPWYTLEAMDQKMRIFWLLYEREKDQEYLLRMYTAGDRALQLLRKLRQSRADEGEKLRDNANWRCLSNRTIQAVMALHRDTQDPTYLQLAFKVVEESKAMMLLEATVQNHLLENDPSTAQVAEQLRTLNARMYFVRNQISSTSQPVERLLLQEELLRHREEFDKLLLQVQRSNPRYFNLVYGLGIVLVPELQLKLAEEDRSLLEYFYGDNTIYTFLVNPDTLIVHSTPLTQAFEDSLGLLVTSLQNSPAAGNAHAASAYARRAKTVQEVIWDPIAPYVHRKVTIVPDGLLSSLSFEALLDSTGVGTDLRFQDFRYLLERYVISYHYSATFLNDRRTPTSSQPLSVLGIAPSFEGGPGLDPLHMSLEGMQEIATRFEEVQLLTGENATKDAFLKQAGSARIIHLATHGKSNREDFFDSRIYLSPNSQGDSLLHLRDLYGISLPAELAILEACETGSGDYHRGEGVMSLARGFTYAGCRSVLMSLWNVPEDKSTQAITMAFYDGLAAGLPRDEAIAISKRQFLNRLRTEGGIELLKIHPYYWAEMVMIGDQSPLKLKAKPGFWTATSATTIGGTIVVLLLIGLLLRRRISKGKPKPQ